MARSNKTPEQILAMAPTDAMSQASCVAFFAECARWADIERFEQIKETAWLGLKQQDRLCKRNDMLMTLKSQLQAIIDITCQEDPAPDLNPSEPNAGTAASSMTITWPTEGAAAEEPVLPTREGL